MLAVSVPWWDLLLLQGRVRRAGLWKLLHSWGRMLPRLHRYTHTHTYCLFAIIYGDVEACATFNFGQHCQATGEIESRCGGGRGDLKIHFPSSDTPRNAKGSFPTEEPLINWKDWFLSRICSQPENIKCLFRHANDQLHDTTRETVSGIMLGQGWQYSWTTEEHRFYGMLSSFFLIDICSYLLHGWLWRTLAVILS